MAGDTSEYKILGYFLVSKSPETCRISLASLVQKKHKNFLIKGPILSDCFPNETLKNRSLCFKRGGCAM